MDLEWNDGGRLDGMPDQPKASWSPSPQDRYVEYLERELIAKSRIPSLKIVNVTTAEQMNVVRITQTHEGLIIEVQ